MKRATAAALPVSVTLLALVTGVRALPAQEPEAREAEVQEPEASQPWTFEQRGGIALTTRDLGDAQLGVGYGFAGTVGYQIAGSLGIYAGWNWFRFHADESFVGPDVEVDEMGFLYGLQVERPLGPSPLPEVQVRAGLTYEDVEIESDATPEPVDAGYDVGWGVSAVFGFVVAEHWRLGPGLHYRALSPDFPTQPAGANTSLKHLSLDLVFARRF